MESLYKIVGPGLPLTLCLCSLTPTGIVFQDPMVCKIMCGALHPPPPEAMGPLVRMKTPKL